MGLDQSLYDATPTPYNATSNGQEIAYWRKDWDLQNFIASDNCEEIEVTEDFCNDIINNIDHIYDNTSFANNDYKKHTIAAFTEAKKLIQQGREVVYCGDW